MDEFTIIFGFISAIVAGIAVLFRKRFSAEHPALIFVAIFCAWTFILPIWAVQSIIERLKRID